jgi:hypothetical protein
VAGRNVKDYTLEGRPWIRLRLMKELAFGAKTHADLAAEYGSSREAVSRFRKRHEQEIADIIAAADDEFRGVAIADKVNRLAVYEAELLKALDSGDRKSAIRILRNVAEEMGHLPSRMQLSGAIDVHTSYTITGESGEPIDMSKLT